MLLSINTNTRAAGKKRTERLQFFGFDERALQDILFRSLDRLFPDDELILLNQSRRWQEEPYLTAVDRSGNLFIFELKAWDPRGTNPLQVFHYGQRYSTSKYEDLNGWYQRATDASRSLSTSHRAKFEMYLPEAHFNRQQILVVIANGLDHQTRGALQYWRTRGVDIRPWVYRVYPGQTDEMLIEMPPFRVQDDPYEDLAEGYYILNTNIGNDEADHHDMVGNGKAAAYFEPWKFKIERLTKGDVVFLYQSRAGVVGVGEADGTLMKCPYHGKPEYAGQEYSMKLDRFQRVSPPLAADDIRKVTGVNYPLRSTMSGLDAESGDAIRAYLQESGRL